MLLHAAPLDLLVTGKDRRKPVGAFRQAGGLAGKVGFLEGGQSGDIGRGYNLHHLKGRLRSLPS